MNQNSQDHSHIASAVAEGVFELMFEGIFWVVEALCDI